VFSKTVFSIARFLYCNRQVHRHFLITLYNANFSHTRFGYKATSAASVNLWRQTSSTSFINVITRLSTTQGLTTAKLSWYSWNTGTSYASGTHKSFGVTTANASVDRDKTSIETEVRMCKYLQNGKISSILIPCFVLFFSEIVVLKWVRNCEQETACSCCSHLQMMKYHSLAFLLHTKHIFTIVMLKPCCLCFLPSAYLRIWTSPLRKGIF
jgi:hypothetical protein